MYSGVTMFYYQDVCTPPLCTLASTSIHFDLVVLCTRGVVNAVYYHTYVTLSMPNSAILKMVLATLLIFKQRALKMEKNHK